jgi:hypothetical protein
MKHTYKLYGQNAEFLMLSMMHTQVRNYYYYYYLLLLFTAIGFSPGSSSPYTSTHNTNGHVIYIKVTIQYKL